MSSDRALLIGCGEIGSRHLQGLAAVPGLRRIEVVDPRPEALALGRARLAELPAAPAASIRWLESLDDAQPGGAVCVVATQAGARPQAVRRAAEALGYRTFLLEKMVAQSVEAYEQLLALAKAQGLSVWVNCQTRAHPFHALAKQRVGPSAPVRLHVVSGNWGLASGGVHLADLFAYYDGAEAIELRDADIDDTVHASKRGPELCDLSGTLRGTTANGGELILSYAGDHQAYQHITIASRTYRCVVDHLQEWAVESDAESGWAWRSAPCGGQLLVSRLTSEFVADLLARGWCALPTLSQAWVAHRFILEALQPQFARLLNRELDACPAT